MNAPDFFSSVPAAQALEGIPPQLLKITFDYLLAIGTTDDLLRRHYAAHVLAANGGDLSATAKDLGLEQNRLLKLFTDSFSSSFTAADNSLSDHISSAQPILTAEKALAAPVVPAPSPVAATSPGVKPKKIDALIEDAYTQGIGVTAMLQLPGFEGVKKQAISNRVTELKLPHRFPEAALQIKEAAKALHRARVQKKPVVDDDVSTPQAKLVEIQPAYKADALDAPSETAYKQDQAGSFVSAESVEPMEPQSDKLKFNWTPDLIDVLRENYPRLGSKGVLALPEFVNCDVKAIQNKAFRLKIKMDENKEQTPSSELPANSNDVALISSNSSAAKTEETASTLTPNDVAIIPPLACVKVEAVLPALTVKAEMPVETSIDSTKVTAPIARYGSEYYAAKCQPARNDIMSGIDIEAVKAQIAERKRTQLKVALATLPECVTQQLTILPSATTIFKDTPKAAFARQLKAQGFAAIDTNHETQGPGKQTYLCDYYWHKSGVLASVCSGAKLDPTLHLHAQLISPAGTQPLIKSISPMPSGGRYTATCAALNGERKVACLSHQSYSVVDGLEVINSLLGVEVLLLRKMAVPPRADDHGFVTFKGSIARHKRLSLSVTHEPLKACCFPDTKAVFTSHL